MWFARRAIGPASVGGPHHLPPQGVPQILGGAPMITVVLPMPPSVNQLYATIGRKRVKTRHARAWHKEAAWTIKLGAWGQRIEGPWAIGVVLPKAMKGDPDNRLKAIL